MHHITQAACRLPATTACTPQDPHNSSTLLPNCCGCAPLPPALHTVYHAARWCSMGWPTLGYLPSLFNRPCPTVGLHCGVCTSKTVSQIRCSWMRQTTRAACQWPNATVQQYRIPHMFNTAALRCSPAAAVALPSVAAWGAQVAVTGTQLGPLGPCRLQLTCVRAATSSSIATRLGRQT